jgi:hypothetical protein
MALSDDDATSNMFYVLFTIYIEHSVRERNRVEINLWEKMADLVKNLVM